MAHKIIIERLTKKKFQDFARKTPFAHSCAAWSQKAQDQRSLAPD